MNNDEKILKALVALQADVSTIKENVTTLKDGQTHTNTAMKALATKQDVEAAKTELKAELASKADVLDLGAKIDKTGKSYKTRLEELEKEAGIINRDKN